MNILSHIAAGVSCIFVRTVEQERATTFILNELESDDVIRDFPRQQWRCTTGLTEINRLGHPRTTGKVQIQPVHSVLNAIAQKAREATTKGIARQEEICFLYNIHHFLKDQPPVQQALRDAAYALRNVGGCLILISPDMEIPAEVDELVTVVDFDLPNRTELKTIFQSVYETNKDTLGVTLDSDDFDSAADALVGLPGLKAEAGFARCLSDLGVVDTHMLQSEKEQAIKRQGILEFMQVDEEMSSLAGFDRVKEFVKERGDFASKAAKEYHLDPPKGILLIGLPGCGKTLAAKAIASAMGLRLYLLNLGNVFHGIVGSSEARVRQALRTAEMAAPCVLLIDEIEKAFAGMQGSGNTDSGVTSRVIATVMTWMQERKSNVFLVGTANTVRGLDPAFLRAGRWDKAFGVDLPLDVERDAIFKIHLTKRSRDPKNFDIPQLVEASENFVGSEIEVCIVNAMYTAFHNKREVTTEDILGKIAETKPLAVTSADLISEFREEWLKTRLEPVSTARVSPMSVTKLRVGGSAVRGKGGRKIVRKTGSRGH